MTSDRSPEVPETDDGPSPKVIDELHAAFGNDVEKSASAQLTKPTRVMSDTEFEALPEAVAEPAIVAESTRRSRRRSRREAKREAKLEAKRVAKLAKEQARLDKKRAKAERKAAKKSRRQPEVNVEGRQEDDEGTVRVIAGPPSPGSASPASTAARATISIDDDGLPDALYLAGDLGTGGSAETVGGAAGDARSTVFIDDRGPGTGEIVSIDVATSVARMEPRMRERRIAVKRATGRKRLKWAAVATVTIGITVGTLAVLGSGAFAITTVDVEGAVYSQGPQLDEVIDYLEGANVLRVDTDRAERMLEQIPWVADARVTTDFPHGATIEVRERRPMVAYLGSDNRYRVLDMHGRVLDVIDGRPVDYLELFVDDPPDLEAGQIAPPGYRAAATLVSALTPHMRQLTTSVSAAEDASELSLMLDDQIEVRFGAAEDLLDKLVRLQTALTDPDPERVPTDLIDVSTEDLIIR